PSRATLCALPLERAATVTELAQAVGRPKSTVAYHVNLLVNAGLLRVVRTRRVRAIDERYYGRVARTFYIGALSRAEDKEVVAAINGLAEAAAESVPAHLADDLRCLLVHARIPIEDVRTFWAQVQEVARRFAQIPRAGNQVYGLVAGLSRPAAPPLAAAPSVPGERTPPGWGSGRHMALKPAEHSRALINDRGEPPYPVALARVDGQCGLDSAFKQRRV